MSESYGGTAAPQGADTLAPFVEAFPPGPDVQPAQQPFLDYAADRLPAPLVQLWARTGLGFYGEQRIALVDPGAWIGVLSTWLGQDVTSIPFAVTSFGHVYHYDRVGGRDRIQCLDPHFQTNTVVGDDLVAFFNEHLPGPSSHLSDLEGPRGGARAKLGELATDECYYFDPILALGGTVSPDALAKGNGPEHLLTIHDEVLVGS
ncbi:T6SS immunity protein Tdi1 domain-containing protein [Dermacoccaceae bacterium W4C1]